MRETDESDPGNEVLWRLEARASVPGVDYHARFEVPVFRTQETEIPLPPEENESLADYAAEYRQLPDSRIYVTSTLRRTEIFFAPARNLGLAAGLTIFFAIWTAVTVALPRLGAPIVFPVVFAAFDLLLAYALLGVWLGTTRVIVTSSAAEVCRGLLGLGLTRRIAVDDIEDVILNIGMQSGSTAYYDIRLVLRDGKQLHAGSSLRDKREAAWLVEQMKTRLGLEG